MVPTRPETPWLPVAPVVVGLGANLGEPRAQLREALGLLVERVGGPWRASSLYRTAAWGLEQSDFLNAAVLLDYPGELERLLDVTQDIEQRLGRVREVRWGPRTLDLDLLLAGSRMLTTERLTVPHALLHERAFALLPLLELQPDAVDPRTGASYAARVAAFHSQRIERLEGPEWAK